jgi:hypothetical protein
MEVEPDPFAFVCKKSLKTRQEPVGNETVFTSVTKIPELFVNYF